MKNSYKDISMLEEGKTYYYLSVPNMNNWYEIKVLSAVQKKENNFTNCVYSDSEEDISKYGAEIKKLFSSKETQDTEVIKIANTFYRIATYTASDIKTVHVIPINDNEIEYQYKSYPENIFTNKEEAVRYADKIAEICKFKRSIPDRL